MNDWLTEARAIAPAITELRRAVHRRPELGNQEYETAARIEAFLRDCGIETRRLLDTAVVGVLKGAKPGPAAALRADMDALPIREATGADFASEVPGVMHACGHDVHVAAALGAAKLLSDRRESLPGTAVFLFQPDEEGNGGAARMIGAGCLDGVDAVFGAHVSPDLPLGSVGVRYGKSYAASDMFYITLTGKSAHGAERERGVDALAAAAALVPVLLAMPESFPGERCVVSVGTLQSGTAINIVPDRAELTGILRALGPDTREEMGRRLRAAVEEIAVKYGVAAECRIRKSYPGVVNHNAETALAERTARALLGDGAVAVLDEPTLTTEDFGYFLMERPGTFYHIGAGCPLPLHNDAFLPDDGAAVVGAAVHAAVLEAYLNSDPKGNP